MAKNTAVYTSEASAVDAPSAMEIRQSWSPAIIVPITTDATVNTSAAPSPTASLDSAITRRGRGLASR